MDDHGSFEDTFPGEGDQSSSDCEARYGYAGHHTFTNPKTGGRLVMDFADMDTGEPCSMFFNVETIRQRGPHKGEPYPAGQFYPPERGTFRKLWMQVVGKPPQRWSEVHRRIKSKFKGLEFTGHVTHQHTGNRRYKKLDNLRVISPAESGDNLGTRKGQDGDNLGTTRGQQMGTSKPDKPLQHKAERRPEVPASESTYNLITSPPNNLSPVDACPSLEAMRASQPEGWGWWGYILPDGSRGSIRGPWPDEQSAMAALEEMFNQTATMIIPFPGTLPHVHSSPENDGTGRVMI